MILLNPMQCYYHSYAMSASLSHRMRASYANCPRPSVSRNSESKHVSFSSFLPSSLLEVGGGESKRQLGSCITRTRTQSKATQTDTDTDGGRGEGRGRLLLRKETWAHPNHFPMSKGDDPNNTLFPVPFALRPLMDGYNFPNNLDCFVPFYTRQQRVREGKRERGAQQFGPPLSSPPLA